MKTCVWLWALLLSLLHNPISTLFAFEGRISATLTRGGETQKLLYTVGEQQLRIERTETDWPHPRNIVNLDTGEVTLLFPHNRSFVRPKSGSQEAAPVFPGAPPMPPLPPGIGPRGTPGAPLLPSVPGGTGAPDVAGAPALPVVPQLPPGVGPRTTPGIAPALPSVPGAAGVPGVPAVPALPAMPQLPSGIGPQSQPGIATTPGVGVPGAGLAGGPPPFPAMPMMPPMPGEQLELKATDEKKEILGFPCTRYELKQRGEVMEIWATDKLLPFQPWQANQPHRFGPRMMEERWGEMLKAKKLFPLLAILRFETRAALGETNQPAPGPERLHFEVKSIKPEKIPDPDGALFQPPPDYHEIQPLPF